MVMSQKYLIRIAELERLFSEQAEALRHKDQQRSQVEETATFLRSALTRAEKKIEENEREIEHLRTQIEKLRRMLLRAVCSGKKHMFFGSDHGGEHGALLYGLIVTSRLNGIVPETYLCHFRNVLPEWPSKRVDELRPWNMVITNK